MPREYLFDFCRAPWVAATDDAKLQAPEMENMDISPYITTAFSPSRAPSPPIVDEVGSRLSDDPVFERINPQLLAQPNIGADKLRAMWKEAMKRWNNLKLSTRSGDSEGLLEKSEGVQESYPKVLFDFMLQC